MSFDIWVFLEWFGTVFALSGSLVLATHKFKPPVAWILWLLSNVLFVTYFLKTGQNGLLLLNIVGFVINLFGLFQWIQHEATINKNVTQLLLNLALIFFAASSFYIAAFLVDPSIKNAEWIGSTLGIAAAFLISSRHKYSFLCWFVWCVSNFSLLVIAWMNKQYGLVFLQSGFMIINVFGAISWVKKYRLTHSVNNEADPVHIMELPSET